MAAEVLLVLVGAEQYLASFTVDNLVLTIGGFGGAGDHIGDASSGGLGKLRDGVKHYARHGDFIPAVCGGGCRSAGERDAGVVVHLVHDAEVLLDGVGVGQHGLPLGDAAALLAWAVDAGVHLRFIEQMPLDAQHSWERTEMITGQEILASLRAEFDLEELPGRGAAPAERFRIDGGPATVGVVASVTMPSWPSEPQTSPRRSSPGASGSSGCTAKTSQRW